MHLSCGPLNARQHIKTRLFGKQQNYYVFIARRRETPRVQSLVRINLIGWSASQLLQKQRLAAWDHSLTALVATKFPP